MCFPVSVGGHGADGRYKLSACPETAFHMVYLSNMYFFSCCALWPRDVMKRASERESVGFGVIYYVDCSLSLHIGYKCYYENKQHTKGGGQLHK